MKVDWIQKLSSRKFWLCLCGFISALLVAFNVGENDIAQVTAIISAFGTLMIYILSEGAVDKANALANQTMTSVTSTNNTEKTYTTLLNKDLNKEAEAINANTTVKSETEEKVKIYG